MIRPETFSDYAAIATVLTKPLVKRMKHNWWIAFGRAIATFRLYPWLQSGMVQSLVTFLFSYVDLVSDETRRILALAPVAVQPAFQTQGIGSALVSAGLTIADSMGEALVVVLGHPSFYPRFGFTPSVQYAIACPFPVPDDVFMVKPLQHFQPVYRGKVIYPSAFNDV